MPSAAIHSLWRFYGDDVIAPRVMTAIHFRESQMSAFSEGYWSSRHPYKISQRSSCQQYESVAEAVMAIRFPPARDPVSLLLPDAADGFSVLLYGGEGQDFCMEMVISATKEQPASRTRE